MEREKSLKDTPLGFSFSCYHDKYEKMGKVYLVAFSCIYEHEKEQRLSSITYSHVFTSMRKNKD